MKLGISHLLCGLVSSWHWLCVCCGFPPAVAAFCFCPLPMSLQPQEWQWLLVLLISGLLHFPSILNIFVCYSPNYILFNYLMEILFSWLDPDRAPFQN